jgi:hypothetical protein
MPSTSIRAAINGPDRPYRNRLMANASDMTGRSQPNSFSKGTINTPEEDLIIPATIIAKKVTDKMIQL